MNYDDLSIAMLVDAAARADVDPLTRFIRSLSNDPPMRLRSFTEETCRLRDELEHHTRCMLTATDPREASVHAEWLRVHVHEVAYRWASLRMTLQRWSELEAPRPVCIKVGR